MELMITKEALKLLDKGFMGNGCGSLLPSRLLCKVAMLPFNSTLIDSLEQCFTYHDAEYTISTSKKSKGHKQDADRYLAENMRYVFKCYNKDGFYSDLFIRWTHKALLLGGSRAYWGKKSFINKWNILPNSVTTIIIIGLLKSFGLL